MCNRFFLLVAAFIWVSGSSAQQLNHPTAVSANSGSVTGNPDKYGRPAPDSRGWTDPALAHNSLLQQRQGEGNYKLVGTFKVKGTPFLYGGLHKGNVFSTAEKAWNITISYNTYNQELEFYSTANPTTPYVKEPGDLDSFIIQKDPVNGITSDLKFVYGPLLGTKEKVYFLEIRVSEKFSLYKSYKSKLGFVSSNYTQPDLRQFDLEYDYFYATAGKKGLKKLKANSAVIVKEFREHTDLSTIVTADAFTMNQDETLRKAFEALNN